MDGFHGCKYVWLVSICEAGINEIAGTISHSGARVTGKWRISFSPTIAQHFFLVYAAHAGSSAVRGNGLLGAGNGTGF
jgi:hypothetical protein